MTLSIVIPTYNGEKYIASAIGSALSQTRPADEIIISDDNSTDSTLRICRQYGDKIKIFTNPDGPSGFVNGWNNTIAHASGDFISILHQDDLLDSTFLEEVEKAYRLHPDVKHFFAACRYIDGEGNTIRESEYELTGEIRRFTGQEYANEYELIKNHLHRCPGVVTHRDIFKVCSYREEAGHIADDDFFLRVGNYTDVVGILSPLASYREHISSETGHLTFLEINSRLLHDYHYQLKHADENPLISPTIKAIFCQWESEYIHRLIVFGLKGGKLKFAMTALRYWFSFKKNRQYGNILYDLKKLLS